MPVYAKQPIIPCAGCARLLRRAAWVSWCSSSGILLYIPAMFKAELVKRKTALKELIVKLLALWWDARAEQSDPHSCSYRRNCLLVVVVLPAADWRQCLVLGDLPAGWSHTAPQGRVQTEKQVWKIPVLPSLWKTGPAYWKDFVTPVLWTGCYYLLNTDAELILSSVVCVQSNNMKTQIRYTKELARWWGFLRLKSGHFSAWLSYRSWMNSFFLEAETRMVLSTQEAWKIMWKYLWHVH